MGALPYDGNVTPDGRHYLAGLFGEDGVVHVDLWRSPLEAQRILDGYGRDEEKLPVYKMPHLEGWAASGDRLLIPAVGRHELIAVDLKSFKEIGGSQRMASRVRRRPPGRPPRVGEFRPSAQRYDRCGRHDHADGRASFRAGPAVLHMEFARAVTRCGCRCATTTGCSSTTPTFAQKGEIAAGKPSGIFFTARATKIRQDDARARASCALIDRWQRNFPLEPRPYATVGRSMGRGTPIAAFERLIDAGVITRIGAVVKPHAIGASTLAAVRAPAARLNAIAAAVSGEPLVNHNYQREHPLNPWFVIAGPDRAAVTRTIERIERATGLSVLDLPLVDAYHLDLGFPLTAAAQREPMQSRRIEYWPRPGDRRVLAHV